MKLISIERITIVVVFIFFTATGFSQIDPDKSLPTGRALEVTFLEGKAPGLMSLPSDKATGSWFSLFGRDKAFKPLPADVPVRAVNIVARYSGEIAAVKVSVFRGKQFHDEEIEVANLNIQLDSSVTVEELRKFGVEPFNLKLVRSEPTVGELPSVVNETRSLQANIEPVYETIPSAKARIFNFSDKAVLAISFGTRSGKRMLLSGMPHGKQGRALIDPNEYHDLEFRVTRPPSIETSNEGIEFVIRSVVFADGSFEGDEGEALTFRSFMLGRKSQLLQVIPVIKKALANKENVDLDRLVVDLTELGDGIDENEINGLRQLFPRLASRDVKSTVTIGSRGVKRDVEGALNDLRNRQDHSAAYTKSKVAELLGEYEAFLARLSK